MTCSTSMCLSELRKNLGYIIYRSFELRLILFLFYLNCACVHKCVLVFNLLYTASSACVLTRYGVGFYITLHGNAQYYSIFTIIILIILLYYPKSFMFFFSYLHDTLQTLLPYNRKSISIIVSLYIWVPELHWHQISIENDDYYIYSEYQKYKWFVS